jgi:FtsZ-binding cell division protein ZapB
VLSAKEYVKPQLSETNERVKQVRRSGQDSLQVLRLDEISTTHKLASVEAVIDTFYLPAFRRHAFLLDSLLEVRRAAAASAPPLEASIDTAVTRIESIDARIGEARVAVEQKEREIDETRRQTAALRDSLLALTDEQDVLRDRLYRLQHPEEFDRARDLVPPAR